MKARFLKLPLLTGLFLSAALFVSAQPEKAPPTCDQALASAQAELQKQANETCYSATRCITCTEKKSGAVVYATLVAKPTCKPDRKQKADPSPTSMAEHNKPNTVAKAAEPRPAPPMVDVLQQRCEDGSGVDLSVFIPGNTLQCGKGDFSFLWEVDGGKNGHAAELQCVCGKVAQVTVTDTKTGLSSVKRIELMPCGKK